MDNERVLVIGLGSTSNLVLKKMISLQNIYRNKFTYIACDVDNEFLEKLNLESLQILTCNVSSNITVGEYFSQHGYARDAWFPSNGILKNQFLKNPTDRCVSRLAFESAIEKDYLHVIYETIETLSNELQNNKDAVVRVVILGSIGAPFSSGVFLSLTKYLRMCFKQICTNLCPIINGYFMLPDIFYKVITDGEKQNMLRVNAYSTMRELNAFNLKDNDLLPDQYLESTIIDLPKKFEDVEKSYGDREGFDFCYFFDAWNIKGEALGSIEDYLYYCANCISTQFTGPMKRISDPRYNDARGQIMYISSGASALVYPYEDIKNLIAFKWIKERISKQWLKYDELFSESCIRNNENYSELQNIDCSDPDLHYIETVENMANKGDSFSETIIKSCSRFAIDGITKESNNWESYVEFLIKHIKDSVKEMAIHELNDEYGNIKQELTQLSHNWSDYANVFESIKEYKEMKEVVVDDKAKVLSFLLFNDWQNNVNTKNMYDLKYYIKDVDDNYIHPNAIRYLLGKIVIELNRFLTYQDSILQKFNEYLESFTEQPLNKDDLYENKKNNGAIKKLIAKVTNKNKRDINYYQEDLRVSLRILLRKVKEYHEDLLLKNVLLQVVGYINDTLSLLRGCYSNLNEEIKTLDRCMNDIISKLNSKDVSPVKYVCSSKGCLDTLFKQTSMIPQDLDEENLLIKNLINKLFLRIPVDDSNQNNHDSEDVSLSPMINYYKNQIEKKYGPYIDLDIFDALMKEAEIIIEENTKKEIDSKLENEYDKDKEIIKYIVNKIENVRNLSIPFVDSFVSEPKSMYQSCTYIDWLNPRDNSIKSNLIDSELCNKGGEGSKEIPKNVIIFYSYFKDLKISELSKFSPPLKNEKYSSLGGDCYNSYYNYIKNKDFDSKDSLDVTPHINKLWHSDGKLPKLT